MKKPNHLIEEKSPYLQQHAYNPVEWYPWSDKAFEKAKNEDKPIFLSIGYSTCHWCHVMEKESFEDEEVAELMNNAFVNIKVDREERPDIDNIYMTVCQMITGSGGWPLTIIMTPDKKPFFAGTYYPKSGRYDRAGLMEIIPKIIEYWNQRRGDVDDTANEIIKSLNKNSDENIFLELPDDVFEKAFNEFRRRFDPEYGGFGTVPKFPTPHNLYFLFRYWKHTKDNFALQMALKTLDGMRLGGIYDHIGKGFHRYSTDQEWLVPHFEKMLYDQALIAQAFIEAYIITKDEFYKQTVNDVLYYVLSDMTSLEGGFYSAEDADSEGIEGKFYLWRTEDLKEVLTNDEYKTFTMLYNTSEQGNWVDQFHNENMNTNIPHLKDRTTEVPQHILDKLFLEREKRIHPHKDDKIITDWNGLMISTFANAYRITKNEKHLEAGENAIDFIFKKLSKENKLLHRYRDGEAVIDAFIDDYIFLAKALIDLYETTFNYDYINKAVNLIEQALEKFWDNQGGGFYFTSNNSDELIVRQKEIYDGAVPSANSVALIVLSKLFLLTGDTKYYEKADFLSKAFSSQIGNYPAGYTQFLCGLYLVLGSGNEIVIVDGGDASKYTEYLNENYNPSNTIIVLKEDNKPENFSTFKLIDNKTTVYICKNFQCNMPVNNFEDFQKLMG
ncbi:MAG TPA: thioredoxin domain-containing protein [Ignavibacteriaceae bacterium]|nr:thioredoxin domain-containing protein [Ignavibacteriaceae bacterium]